MRKARRFRSLAFAGLLLGAPLPLAPSVVAAPRLDYAERPVREFLKIHFAGSRDFTARGLDRKERFLSRRL